MKKQYRSAYDKLETDEALQQRLKQGLQKKAPRSSCRWAAPLTACACLALCALVLVPTLKDALVPNAPQSSAASVLPSSSGSLALSKGEARLDEELNRRLEKADGDAEKARIYSDFAFLWKMQMESVYDVLSQGVLVLSSQQEDWQNSLPETLLKQMRNQAAGDSTAMTSFRFLMEAYRGRAVLLARQLPESKLPVTSVLSADSSFSLLSQETAKELLTRSMNPEESRSGRPSITPIGEWMKPYPGAWLQYDYGSEKQEISGSIKYRLFPGVILGSSPTTPAIAATDGTVAYSGIDEYGGVLILSHGDGVYTVYGGLSCVVVANGETADKGTVLGYGTPDSEGKESLYFALYVNKGFDDPGDYFDF